MWYVHACMRVSGHKIQSIMEPNIVSCERIVYSALRYMARIASNALGRAVILLQSDRYMKERCLACMDIREIHSVEGMSFDS